MSECLINDPIVLVVDGGARRESLGYIGSNNINGRGSVLFLVECVDAEILGNDDTT